MKTPLVFVDTNVLVYLRDAMDGDRRSRAAEWMAYLWESRSGRLSTQVLHEYYVTVTSELDPGMPADKAREDIVSLRAWSPLPINPELTEWAWDVQERWEFSFWDSLIVAAAKAQGCALLLTEELTHGQDLDGLRVVSPFLEEPPQAP
ncbi:PIN domain-containing protein [Gemmatimonadota bacterium]